MLAAPEDDAHAIPAGEPTPQSRGGDATPISVAILCGGASRRMGSDKALLPLQPGTPPMLKLVIARLRGLSDDLFLVGVNRPGYDRFGVPLVEDRFPSAGPLGGIATALSTSKHTHCLIVACDMPFLDPNFLRWLAVVPRDNCDALVPTLAETLDDGSLRLIDQPLHAIYSRRCLPAIERRLQAGERRATDFFADVRVKKLSQDQFGSDETRRRSFFSVDTPASVRLARTWLLA